jgi:hypothetical protein
MDDGFSTVWFAVAYVIAAFAVLAAVTGGFLLRRGGGLAPAFLVLLAPWALVVFNLRIVPVYLSFAFDPDAWGNVLFPVWMSPLVGLGLVIAGILRTLNARENR